MTLFLAHGSRSRAASVTLIVFISFLFVPTGARAVNEPLLRGTTPREGAYVRSSVTPSISAVFDRDLALPPSSITLRDKNDALVPGYQTLVGPHSGTGGHRTIALLLDDPLDESLSPYRGIVRACPYVPGDCSNVTFTFRVDDTAPAAPSVTSPVNGSVNDEQQPLARGTSEPGATVVIFEHNQELTRAITHTDGSWITQLPYPPEDGTLHTVTVRAVDEAGNWGAATTVTFRHDSIVRPPWIFEPLQNAAYATTNVPVYGTAKAGTTVKVFEGATELGSALVNAEERWSMTISVSEGSHVIVAYSYDVHETTGPSQARTFVVDLTGPVPPVILTPTPAAHVPSRQVTVSGTAEPSANVRLREGAVVRATVPVSQTGEWSASLTFGEGARTVTAETVDQAGNTSGQAARSFTVDTISPGAPLIDTPAQNAFLNTNSVYVSGSAEPDTNVQVLEGQSLLGTVLADGVGSWGIVVTMPDAGHTIEARSVDRAGNVGVRSLPRSFSVDTIAPATPVILVPAAGASLTANPVKVSGTGEPASHITVTESSVVLGTAVVDAGGRWDTSIMFPDGPHTIVARANDLAGNLSGFSAPRSFTVTIPVDTVPPAAPVIAQPAEGSLRSRTVTFSGSAEPSATVRVFEGTTLVGSGTATTGGFWSFGAPLDSGSHAVTAVAIDRSGNVGPPSAVRTFTVDADPPVVTLDPASSSLIVRPVAPGELFGGASDNNAVVRIELEYRDRVRNILLASAIAETCTGCPGSPVAWATEPDILPGAYLVRIAAVDAIGNRSDAVTTTLVIV